MSGERWRVVVGDCRDVMAGMDADSVDAVVTDPPYGLEFMGKEWDRLGDSPIQHAGPSAGGSEFSERMRISYNTGTNVRCQACERWRVSSNPCRCERPDFPNQRRHEAHQMQAWHETWATEALRVLKPGGHLLAFGGTRTAHRLVSAVEDAGFEIRDTIAPLLEGQPPHPGHPLYWVQGQGFPKSLDVAHAINTAACPQPGGHKKPGAALTEPEHHHCEVLPESVPWQGWGTALAPAHEPIVVARKPLVGTVAGNVLEWGVGGLNIDNCRIPSEPRPAMVNGEPGTVQRVAMNAADDGSLSAARRQGEVTTTGRWPANVVLDEAAARMLDQSVGATRSAGDYPTTWQGDPTDGELFEFGRGSQGPLYADAGGPSRYFYTAKAGREERNAGLNNHHPTVKPLDLMRWLVRLVTPPDGLILDPFTGSGTTGAAALLEGYRFLGVEQDPDYAAIAEARIVHWAQQGHQPSLL